MAVVEWCAVVACDEWYVEWCGGLYAVWSGFLIIVVWCSVDVVCGLMCGEL